LQLHGRVARDAEEFHREAPCRVEAVEQLLRRLLQGLAHGRAGQIRERQAAIAMACEFGIERHGPQARNARLEMSGETNSGFTARQSRQ